MLRKASKKPQTVAEKVSKLLAHPNESDSEDESDIDVATTARIAEFDDEYDLPDGRSTEFRKRNVKLLSEQSERYKGKISSRKELEQESGEEDANDDDDEDEELAYEESDSDEDNLKAFNEKLKASKHKDQNENDDDSSMEDSENDSQQEEQDDDEDDDDDEEEDDEDDSENDSDNSASEADANEIMSKTNQQAEIQKGLCVQNQLRIWERLLELRINTQKVTSKANQLPPPETLTTLCHDNEELQTVLKEAQERSSKLLQQLLALQMALTQQHGELRQCVKRKQPAEESGQPESKRFANALQHNFENMRSYRNEVLLKWDDRTKLLTPGAGVKRKSLQEDYDIIKKIDNALTNREALVEKSQTPKSNQQLPAGDDAVDQAESTAGNSRRQPDIYDDSDFYHQQLRELIEYKASTTSNMSDITKQFVELQKLRQKMKKKVDTRASKGRKLRYVVHNKLINFMAPNEASDWTEDSKTELYRSLFV
ncbi:protein Aatf [Drosophila grimshawi]|uniref:GH10706 n=1 Tax=Drosophila grimshawi TaxID=7222 RepID=B4JC35_DROGR|nr:protein Aatf [Drosophila grimshawi]EDW03048.1 GH10706 [Drosophila grimshawi]